VDALHSASWLLDRAASVDALAVSLALAFHIARRAARARAWQNTVLAAYPGARLSYPAALTASLAALGFSSLSPVRGSEVVRVALIRPRVPDASWTTLGSTLVVESVIDAVVAAGLCVAALAAGAIPGVAGLGLVVVRRGSLASVAANARRGLAVFGNRRRLITDVVSWIGLSWVLRLAAIYWFLEAFSIDPSVTLVLTVVSVQCLASLVPVAWIGSGAQAGVLLIVLAEAAGAGPAASFVVGSQAATLVCNVALGVIAALAGGFSIGARMALTPPPRRSRA
jgi:hypothetical protein